MSQIWRASSEYYSCLHHTPGGSISTRLDRGNLVSITQFPWGGSTYKLNMDTYVIKYYAIKNIQRTARNRGLL